MAVLPAAAGQVLLPASLGQRKRQYKRARPGRLPALPGLCSIAITGLSRNTIRKYRRRLNADRSRPLLAHSHGSKLLVHELPSPD